MGSSHKPPRALVSSWTLARRLRCSLSIAPGQHAHHLCRIAFDVRIWGNIGRDDGARSHNAPVADAHARKDNRAQADPAPIADLHRPRGNSSQTASGARTDLMASRVDADKWAYRHILPNSHCSIEVDGDMNADDRTGSDGQLVVNASGSSRKVNVPENRRAPIDPKPDQPVRSAAQSAAPKVWEQPAEKVRCAELKTKRR